MCWQRLESSILFQSRTSHSPSALAMSFSCSINSFLLFVCMQDQPDFTAQHHVVKDDAENSDFKKKY